MKPNVIRTLLDVLMAIIMAIVNAVKPTQHTEHEK